MKQPSRAIINGRIVCAIHNPKPDQRAHRRDERPRREFDRPEMAHAGAPMGPAAAPAGAPTASVLPAPMPAAAEGPAVTPEEAPAPGQQDTVPPVASDPALHDVAAEPTPTGTETTEESPVEGGGEGGPARRTRRAATDPAEAEATT